MANILYRTSTTATIPGATSAKGTPLTNLEVDGNFRSLNQGLTDLAAAVPALNGTGATGTWGISITGNAGTVTNGVYTTGSYADPSWITSLSASKVSGVVLESGSYANPTWIASLAGSKVTGAVLTTGTYADPSWITSLAYTKVGIPSVSGQSTKVLSNNGSVLQWITAGTGGVADGNTTYTLAAATATGGANISLAGSDASTDNVKLASGTNVTVAYTDANTITISSSYVDTNTTYTLGAAAADANVNANIQLTASGGGGTQNLKLIAGTNVSLAVSGNNITISSSGSGGGTDTYYTYALSAVANASGAGLRNTSTQYIGGVGQTPTTADIVFAEGSGIDITGTGSTITIAHVDTSTVANLTAASRTYVTGLTFDTFGHITGYSTGTETVTDTDTNFYPTTWTWTAGTTAGPTASLSGVGMTSIAVAAVPVATSAASGVVSTTTQSFAGAKTFTGAVTVASLSTGGTIAATGAITSQADITAFSSSDSRLKENVVQLSNSLEKVNSIRGVRFDWTDNYLENINPNVKKHDVGVIAQEVEEVLPEVVGEMSSGYKGVRYDRLVPLLIEAIKELSARVQELEAR